MSSEVSYFYLTGCTRGTNRRTFTGICCVTRERAEPDSVQHQGLLVTMTERLARVGHAGDGQINVPAPGGQFWSAGNLLGRLGLPARQGW